MKIIAQQNTQPSHPPPHRKPTMNNDTIAKVLREICEMQAENYGNGIDTHIDLIALCAQGRKALATSATPGKTTHKPKKLAVVAAFAQTIGSLGDIGEQEEDAPSSGESADSLTPGTSFMVGFDSLLRQAESFDGGKITTAAVREFVLSFQRPAPAAHSSAPSDREQIIEAARDWGKNGSLAKRLAAPTGESLPWQGVPEITDEQMIGVLHSLGTDTTLSVYGFDSLQVSGTNVPNMKAIVQKCIACIRNGVWPAPMYDFDSDGQVMYRSAAPTGASK